MEPLARQAMDADVEKAADGQAEDADRDQARHVGRLMREAGPDWASAATATVFDTLDASGHRIELERCARRIGRNPGEEGPRRISASHVTGSPAAREAPDEGFDLIDEIQGVELKRDALGVPPQPLLVGLQHLLPQETRCGAVVPCRQHAGGERLQPVRRVRLFAARAGTTSPPSCSRGGASSRRSRCRSRYCHFPGCAAMPFARSALRLIGPARARREPLRSERSRRIGRRW